MKRFLKIGGLFLLFQIIYIPILCIGLVFYGPFTNVRDMIVTTAMTTMTHQYFATWFLSDEQIDSILKANRPEENIESQDISDITINENSESDKNGIEVVDVSSSTFKGYLMIVNDPSRVKLASAPKLGKVGATTSQIVEENNAIAGINAGGFQDDALGTGGKPDGLVIENGELISGNSYTSYGIVGLDASNRLVVSNAMTYNKAKALGLKSAVAFGPVIIINGQPTIRSGNGGWGIQPRTAIGQTKDGKILMLVIDGRQTSSLGATLKNVQDILLQYGAYNAFNLDGGASSTMVYDGKVVNSPSDIMGERYVPNAFIVTKPVKK
ncbi:MAG: phosphodiester glycosidase family protein [Clostridia bacterium]|nr:phosphodiester glycosidase family protein [Clostridia bacterium]